MDTVKRMRLIQVLKKMEKNPGFSEKLGMKNNSRFRTVREKH